MADKLHGSDPLKEKASSIYLKAHEHGLVRRKSAKVMLVASLYVASRLKGESRTLGHFARASGICKKDLARCYRSLVMRLNLRLPLQDPARCVSKLTKQVGVSTSTWRIATRIVDRATKKKGKISGRNPMSVAAAALYIACLHEREKITQSKIAKAADVTEVTVRNNVICLREGTLADNITRRRRHTTKVKPP